jgi:oligopeptide/dipeptide ABC transporter ATP-binding protein
MPTVLEIRNLSTHIQLSKSVVQAVGNIDLTIEPGETLGLVGESGCGKSMTGLSIMGLLPPGGRIVGGSIKLAGRELVGLSDARLRAIRGNEVAMIFQDPLTSLDPTKTIGYQVAEPIRLHRGAGKQAAMDRAAEVLAMVGLPRPRERLGDYPHQLSGGLRQRVMIAMALTCEPKLLIADEPTTALDVTIQAQILALLDRLKEQLGMAILLITHDMGVIAGHTDRVEVMYAGRLVETADTGTLFTHMHHPYTQALLGSIPRLNQDSRQRLLNIPGIPPDLANPPSGCRFAARCSRATDKCQAEEPPLASRGLDHLFACWHPVDGPARLPDAPATESLASREATAQEAAEEDTAVPEAAAGLSVSGPPEPEAPTGHAAGRGPDARGDGHGPVPAVTVRAAGPDEAAGPGGTPLLEVGDVVKEFPVTEGAILQRRVASVHAVSGVSFTINAGETYGLVGESGCGKTTIGRVIVALERPTAGTVTLRGTNISALSRGDLRRHRRDLQMMFQDPYSSLDPRMRVGAIIREPLAIQHQGSREQQRQRVFELLDEVGLPRKAVERYPHEFSGGQRQRIGLARVLALNPQVIVADEPVSALDVSIRAQVLNLMKRLQADHGLTYIVISHDLAVVKYMADRIGVMYLGKLVEEGSSEDIYQRAAHPYTAGLIATIPVPDPGAAKTEAGIRGELPSPINPPSGCRFRTRCPFAQDLCAEAEPPLRSFGPGHRAACHFPLQVPWPDAATAAGTGASGAPARQNGPAGPAGGHPGR